MKVVVVDVDSQIGCHHRLVKVLNRVEPRNTVHPVPEAVTEFDFPPEDFQLLALSLTKEPF